VTVIRPERWTACPSGASLLVRETKVASEPEALLSVLKNPAYHFKRIGLEAGPLSQWLFSVLAEAGLPVICVETRHMRAVLTAQINKTCAALDDVVLR
jgi:transposase